MLFADILPKFPKQDLKCLIVSNWRWSLQCLPDCVEYKTIAAAISYPQWSKSGMGPFDLKGPFKPICLENFKILFAFLRLLDTVEELLDQKASMLIRLMHAKSFLSESSSRTGNLPFSFKKMHRSHSKGVIKWSPSRADWHWSSFHWELQARSNLPSSSSSIGLVLMWNLIESLKV